MSRTIIHSYDFFTPTGVNIIEKGGRKYLASLSNDDLVIILEQLEYEIHSIKSGDLVRNFTEGKARNYTTPGATDGALYLRMRTWSEVKEVIKNMSK